MVRIADEKNNYYQILKEELAEKYRSKYDQEQLF